jgi:hypothetical protein
MEILDYRWHKGANRMIKQGQVLWSNSTSAESTWEDLEDLHRRFPAAPAWAPLKVLESRWIPSKNSSQPPSKQVLVAWNYSEPEHATWEDFDNMQRLYPDIPAWGQAASQGGGIVSNLTTASPSADAEQQREAKRRSRPNPRYVGPDWVGPRQARQEKTEAPATSTKAGEAK